MAALGFLTLVSLVLLFICFRTNQRLNRENERLTAVVNIYEPIRQKELMDDETKRQKTRAANSNHKQQKTEAEAVPDEQTDAVQEQTADPVPDPVQDQVTLPASDFILDEADPVPDPVSEPSQARQKPHTARKKKTAKDKRKEGKK